MASPEDKDEKRDDAEEGDAETSSIEVANAPSETGVVEAEGTEVTEGETGGSASVLGSERYVHAAFFMAGIIGAYLLSKSLALAWNNLSSWPVAVRAVPQLVSYSEEQRDTIALALGAGLGTLGVVQAYRKERVRTWAGEVAAELAKVTWPTREAVLNGTVVVVVASTLATVYVMILDRIWGFLTTLVYGA